MSEPIPSEYEGWWRIVETSQWVDDGLDIPGPALLSLTGHGDRLRMHCLRLPDTLVDRPTSFPDGQ